MSAPAPLHATCVRGAGEAAGFTGLSWVRDQLLALTGIDPYPGTLNLQVAHGEPLRAWHALRATMAATLVPPDAGWCAARVTRATLAGRLPAAIVWPLVPGYPDDRIEVLAAVGLRATLGLGDGDTVTVEAQPPLAVGTVIFDVDGTLVDSLHAYRIIAERAAAPLGFPITDEQVRRALDGETEDFWGLVIPPDHPDRDAARRALHAAAVACAPEVIAGHARPLPDVADTIARLVSRGFRLGIVTGSGGETLRFLAAQGLFDHFEAVITARDVESRKPHPEGLLACASRMGIDPASAVYVGDSGADVRAARAAGMRSVSVLSGAGTGATLSAHGPDRLIVDHRGLSALLTLASGPA